MKHHLATLALLFLVIIAGCSPAAPTNSNEKTTEVAPAPVEVTFGFLGPLTGGASTIGVPVRDAVKLAEIEVNSKNMIPGKKLVILYEDDQCDAKLSTTAVTKLINVDGVKAIAGGLCSGTTLADAPIAEQNQIVLMSYASTNPAIKNAGDYVFRNVPSDANQGVEGATLIKTLGVTKVGVIHIQNDWGVALTDVFVAEATKKGIDVVGRENYDASATDMRTQITKLKSGKPEAIYFASMPADAGVLIKQLREAGLDVPLVGADGSKDDAVLSAAGSAAEGLILTLPAVPPSSELEAFTTAYTKAYGKEPSAYTPEGYDVVMILAKACAATDCSGPAMKNHLYAMGAYSGASGRYSFDSDGEVTKSYDYFTVKDGKWTKYTVPETKNSKEVTVIGSLGKEPAPKEVVVESTP